MSKARGASSRKRRERPRPKWIATAEVDAMARSRCLMVLSVISGERPVTDVIEELQISRGTYYQMETRALKAMLEALTPGAEATVGGEAREKEQALEKKVNRLEREKRRAERLLLLTRQLVRPAPVVGGGGRPSKRGKRRSTTGGPQSYRALKKTAAATESAPESDSTPTRGGEDGP